LAQGELGVVDVEDVDERLGGQQPQLAQQRQVDLASGPRQRPPRVEHGLRRLRRGEQLLALGLEASLAFQPGQPVLDGLQVREDELGVDRLDVVLGVDAPLDVHDVGV